MSVIYTQPELVSSIATSLYPPRSQSASGYGPKLPTPYLVHYDGRWRRVYAICYGNAASVYLVHGGSRVFLDVATECALSDGLTDERLAI